MNVLNRGGYYFGSRAGEVRCGSFATLSSKQQSQPCPLYPESVSKIRVLGSATMAGHDAAVQMIDTPIVRVHQHGACIAGKSEQLVGRSRGGLTTKIHAVVDGSGLPVRLALTTGEA